MWEVYNLNCKTESHNQLIGISNCSYILGLGAFVIR